jgi:hypothetical protein
MHFEEGKPVRFTLHGAELVVTRFDGRWRLEWQGRIAESPHLDHALAELIEERPSSIMPLAIRVLRAEPGTALP